MPVSVWDVVQARSGPLAKSAEENTPGGKSFWFLFGLVQGYGEGLGTDIDELEAVNRDLGQLLLATLDYYEKKADEKE